MCALLRHIQWSIFTAINYVGVPSAPIKKANNEYQYGCKDFNLTLSWIQPHDDYRIDYYRLRIDGQPDTIINGTSYMIDSLSYFENITVEIDIINCAGEGAESYFTVAKGIVKTMTVVVQNPGTGLALSDILLVSLSLIRIDYDCVLLIILSLLQEDVLSYRLSTVLKIHA